MVDIQREQLDQGKNEFGNPISPYYTEKTVHIKQAKGQPYDRVTLKDTGSFYEGIQVSRINRKSYTIRSYDKKDKKLEKKYGAAIFGLDGPSRAKYIETAFFPELKEFIEKTLKIKMT